MYITICEIDRQSKFDAWRALKAGALGQPWGMGWGGRWKGVSNVGHMYTCGWFMSVYGKNHYNIVKQLASNWNKLIKNNKVGAGKEVHVVWSAWYWDWDQGIREVSGGRKTLQGQDGTSVNKLQWGRSSEVVFGDKSENLWLRQLRRHTQGSKASRRQSYIVWFQPSPSKVPRQPLLLS